MSRVVKTWTVENIWACPNCRTSNRGRDINCKNCGARKDPTVQDQIPDPDTAPEVTDPELLRKAHAGPNWVCEYCGGQERNLRGDCTRCGGPKNQRTYIDSAGDRVRLDNSDLNELLMKAAGRPVQDHEDEANPNDYIFKSKPQEVVSDAEYHKQVYKEVYPEAYVVSGLSPGERARKWVYKNRRTLGWGSLIAVGLGCLVWFMIWIFTPREVNARVDSISWMYISNLRQQEVRHGGEWGTPGGKGFYREPAFNLRCESRYYGTEDCHPHQCNPHQESYQCNCTSYECGCSNSCTNNGNGFSSCSRSCSTCSRCDTCYQTVYDTCYDQCPVYKKWCDYDYYEWPVVQTQQTMGDTHEVYWPKVTPDGPRQRVQKIESYEVNFKTSDDAFQYKPDSLPDFRRFNVKDKWKLQIGKIRRHNIEKMTKL